MQNASRQCLAGGGRGSQRFRAELWIDCTPAPLLLASPHFCSVFPLGERVTALNERERKRRTSYHIHTTLDPALVILPSASGEGKLQLPLCVDGASSYTTATPGVKKLGYVFATTKKMRFAVRSARCICHLTGKPPQRSKLCSSYCGVPPWRDAGCVGAQQPTSLGRRLQLQQLRVLEQMRCHLL